MKRFSYIFIAFMLLVATPARAQTYAYYQSSRAYQTYPVYTAPVYAPSSLTPMSYGAAGSSVVQLQQLLKQLGYFPSYTPVTGFYGWTTVRAVAQFQRAHGILATGSVGTRTIAALNTYALSGYDTYPTASQYPCRYTPTVIDPLSGTPMNQEGPGSYSCEYPAVYTQSTQVFD